MRPLYHRHQFLFGFFITHIRGVVILQKIELLHQIGSTLTHAFVFRQLCKFPGIIKVIRHQQTRRQTSQSYNTRLVLFVLDINTTQFDNAVLYVVRSHVQSQLVVILILVYKEQLIFPVLYLLALQYQVHLFGVLRRRALSPPSDVLQRILKEKSVVPISQVGKSPSFIVIENPIVVLRVVFKTG